MQQIASIISVQHFSFRVFNFLSLTFITHV